MGSPQAGLAGHVWRVPAFIPARAVFSAWVTSGPNMLALSWKSDAPMPLLAALFSAMGVYGGYLIGVVLIGVDEGSFWSQMQSAVDFREDVVNGVIKSCVFGVAVTWIALFEGYDAPPTAEGVSGATTRTVVTSSLAILGLDFVLTAFMFRGI